jgi:hypothetical protein
MAEIFVRPRGFGWIYAFEVDGTAQRGWRPSRHWAGTAAARRMRRTPRSPHPAPSMPAPANRRRPGTMSTATQPDASAPDQGARPLFADF